MSHRVFIAVRSEATDTATALCGLLEANNVACWHAQRDIGAAEKFYDAISEALEASQLLILVLTERSEGSRWLEHEVRGALMSRIPILVIDAVSDSIPLRPPKWLPVDKCEWVTGKSIPIARNSTKILQSVRSMLGDTDTEPLRRDERSDPSPGTKVKEPAHASAYEVFISSKSEDYPHARKAAAVLRKAGLRVFFSEEELRRMGKSDYHDAIDNVLEEVRHMVVVTSSRKHVESPWVKKEWQTYLTEKLSGRKSGNLVTLLCCGMTIGDLPIGLRQHEARPVDELPKLLDYFQTGKT